MTKKDNIFGQKLKENDKDERKTGKKWISSKYKK